MINAKLTTCLLGIMLVSTIFLITPTSRAEQPPVAIMNGPYDAFECDIIFFDARQSYDPDSGDVLQYRWDFTSDGIWDTEWSTNAVTDHTWYDVYQGTVTLEVTDGFYNATATAPVTIANAIPVITNITGPASTIIVGMDVPLTVNFTDGDPRSHLSWDTFTATFNWGDGVSSSMFLPNQTRMFTGIHVYSQPGTYNVLVTILDNHGGSCTGTYTLTVLASPGGWPGAGSGFVTGGGWIVIPAGCYHPDPSITGTANFGFNCKYKKGQQAPTGDLEFNFQEAGLNFHAKSFDWLVVSGDQAQFQGTGKINNAGSYGFTVTVVDGKLNGLQGVSYALKNGGLGHGEDSFQIRIWDKASGTTVFDTGSLIPLSGGNIVIHKS